MEGFTYSRRLAEDEIRLIHIKSGRWNDNITVYLKNHKTRRQPVYYAISYTWGDAVLSEEISVNGTSARITTNLHGALRRCRALGIQDWLWIDAICINQQDMTEKSAQVRIMTDIYERATIVYVWLGEATPDDAAAIELMRKFHESVGATTFEDTSWEHIDFAAFGLPSLRSNAWLALAKFLTKPWFSRAWVVQEFVVSNICIFWCGNLRIEAEVLLGMATNIRKYYQIEEYLEKAHFGELSHPPLPIDLLEMREIWRSDFRLNLITLVHRCQYQEAADPRDKIFAYHGLSRNKSDTFVDYNRSTNEVLIEATEIALFDKLQGPFSGLKVLCAADGGGLIDGRPSWVPDFFKMSKSRVPLSLGLDDSSKTISSRRKVWVDYGTNTLQIYGRVLDSLTQVPANLIKQSGASDVGLFGQTLSKRSWQTFAEACGMTLRRSSGKDYGPLWRLWVDLLGHHPFAVISEYTALTRWIEDARSLVGNSKFVNDDSLLDDNILADLFRFANQMVDIDAKSTYEQRKFNQAFIDLGKDFAVFEKIDRLFKLLERWYTRFGVALGIGACACWFLKPELREWISWVPILSYLENRSLIEHSTSARVRWPLKITAYLLSFWMLPFSLRCMSYSAKFWAMYRRTIPMNRLLSPSTSDRNPLGSLAAGRTLFLSAKRNIGWVPATAAPDDLICVFDGCEIPFVPRSISSSGSYKLIGDCFVLGDGDDEASGLSNEEKRWFRLV